MSECTIGLSEQEIKLYRLYDLIHIKAKNKQVNKCLEAFEEFSTTTLRIFIFGKRKFFYLTYL